MNYKPAKRLFGPIFSDPQRNRLGIICAVVSVFFIHPGSAQDLALNDTTIATESDFAAGSITVGPDFTITGTGHAVLTSNTIAIMPQVSILAGGQLQIITGEPATAIEVYDEIIPEEFAVGRNYPNPFNPTTWIEYTIPQAEHVEIVVYNLSGQKIRTLHSGYQPQGQYTVLWDGLGESGRPVSSGIYYYRVRAGEQAVTRKMTLIK